MSGLQLCNESRSEWNLSKLREPHNEILWKWLLWLAPRRASCPLPGLLDVVARRRLVINFESEREGRFTQYARETRGAVGDDDDHGHHHHRATC